MESLHPRLVRRRILQFLYSCYLDDPLQMLTPSDILDDLGIKRSELSPSIYYLHERGYVEVMVGFNPPLFDAARISPKGIDLVENEEALDQLFPQKTSLSEATVESIQKTLLAVASEAERSDLNGVKLQWLLDDLRELRAEVQRPRQEWRVTRMHAAVRGLEEYFDGNAHGHLPSLPMLANLISAEFEPPQPSPTEEKDAP